jgi:hypothetical protein
MVLLIWGPLSNERACLSFVVNTVSLLSIYSECLQFYMYSAWYNNVRKDKVLLTDRRRHSSILDVRSFRAADCDSDQLPGGGEG